MDNLKISLGFLISLALVFYSFNFFEVETNEKHEENRGKHCQHERSNNILSKFVRPNFKCVVAIRAWEVVEPRHFIGRIKFSCPPRDHLTVKIKSHVRKAAYTHEK
mgnify:CR=1 FL=1